MPRRKKLNPNTQAVRIYFAESNVTDVMIWRGLRAVEENDGGSRSEAGKKLMLLGLLVLKGIDIKHMLGNELTHQAQALDALAGLAGGTDPGATRAEPKQPPESKQPPATPAPAVETPPPQAAPKTAETTPTESPAPPAQSSGTAAGILNLGIQFPNAGEN